MAVNEDDRLGFAFFCQGRERPIVIRKVGYTPEEGAGKEGFFGILLHGFVPSMKFVPLLARGHKIEITKEGTSHPLIDSRQQRIEWAAKEGFACLGRRNLRRREPHGQLLLLADVQEPVEST
jgi:hypothetical protein